jgi:hypothetical protein
MKGRSEMAIVNLVCSIGALRRLVRFLGREDRLGHPRYEYGGPRRSPLPFEAPLVYLLSSILSFAVFGQSPFDEKEEAFLFMARAFGDDYFEAIQFYDDEDVLTTLSLDPYSRTAVYRLPANRSEATFVRVTLDDRGREQEETVAIADLEGIESRAFLVFVSRRDQERNLPYTVYVADESPGEFEAGHLRFLNLAGPRILARVGLDTISLDYGFGGDYQFDAENIEEVPFEFAVRLSDGWKIVYSTGFRAHPEVGTLAILKPPRTLDSMEIQVELSQRRYYFDPPPPSEEASSE